MSEKKTRAADLKKIFKTLHDAKIPFGIESEVFGRQHHGLARLRRQNRDSHVLRSHQSERPGMAGRRHCKLADQNGRTRTRAGRGREKAKTIAKAGQVTRTIARVDAVHAPALRCANTLH